MTNHSLHDLIQELRRTNFAFPLLNQQPYQTIYMRSYAVKENEVNGMVNELEKRLSFTVLIENLWFRLGNEAISQSKSLAVYAGNLHKIFSGYATEGHYPSRYFTKILSSLGDFQTLIEQHRKRDEELMIKLQSLLHGPAKDSSQNFYVEDVAEYAGQMSAYVEELHHYYDIFNDFLQHESDKKQGLNVITRSEQYLSTLTTMTGRSIYLSGSTANLLNRWKSRLLLRDKQVLFN